MDNEECIILIILLLGFLYFLYRTQCNCRGNGFNVGGYTCQPLIKKTGVNLFGDTAGDQYADINCNNVDMCTAGTNKGNSNMLDGCRINCNYKNLCKFTIDENSTDEATFITQIKEKRLAATRNNMPYRNPYDRTKLSDREWGSVYILVNFYLDMINYFTYDNPNSYPLASPTTAGPPGSPGPPPLLGCSKFNTEKTCDLTRCTWFNDNCYPGTKPCTVIKNKNNECANNRNYIYDKCSDNIAIKSSKIELIAGVGIVPAQGSNIKNKFKYYIEKFVNQLHYEKDNDKSGSLQIFLNNPTFTIDKVDPINIPNPVYLSPNATSEPGKSGNYQLKYENIFTYYYTLMKLNLGPTSPLPSPSPSPSPSGMGLHGDDFKKSLERIYMNKHPLMNLPMELSGTKKDDSHILYIHPTWNSLKYEKPREWEHLMQADANQLWQIHESGQGESMDKIPGFPKNWDDLYKLEIHSDNIYPIELVKNAGRDAYLVFKLGRISGEASGAAYGFNKGNIPIVTVIIKVPRNYFYTYKPESAQTAPAAPPPPPAPTSTQGPTKPVTQDDVTERKKTFLEIYNVFYIVRSIYEKLPKYSNVDLLGLFNIVRTMGRAGETRKRERIGEQYKRYYNMLADTETKGTVNEIWPGRVYPNTTTPMTLPWESGILHAMMLRTLYRDHNDPYQKVNQDWMNKTFSGNFMEANHFQLLRFIFLLDENVKSMMTSEIKVAPNNAAYKLWVSQGSDPSEKKAAESFGSFDESTEYPQRLQYMYSGTPGWHKEQQEIYTIARQFDLQENFILNMLWMNFQMILLKMVLGKSGAPPPGSFNDTKLLIKIKDIRGNKYSPNGIFRDSMNVSIQEYMEVLTDSSTATFSAIYTNSSVRQLTDWKTNHNNLDSILQQISNQTKPIFKTATGALIGISGFELKDLSPYTIYMNDYDDQYIKANVIANYLGTILTIVQLYYKMKNTLDIQDTCNVNIHPLFVSYNNKNHFDNITIKNSIYKTEYCDVLYDQTVSKMDIEPPPAPPGPPGARGTGLTQEIGGGCKQTSDCVKGLFCDNNRCEVSQPGGNNMLCRRRSKTQTDTCNRDLRLKCTGDPSAAGTHFKSNAIYASKYYGSCSAE